MIEQEIERIEQSLQYWIVELHRLQQAAATAQREITLHEGRLSGLRWALENGEYAGPTTSHGEH